MTETPSHDLRSALYPNELELVALLKREAEHSGVWFSHSLVSAANLIERLARLRLASDTIGNGGGEAIALEAYRAAVRWVASDSWDGCSDCIKILQMARSLDDFEWTPDHHAQALKRLYERSGSAPVHPPAAEPVGLREAEDVGLRIADRIRQELTSGRQWSLGSMDKAQREEFEAEITSTCVAVCEQEFATPARTDDAAQAGGSVTQSDADAANAWMRDHLDGGNAPGSL
ncbi:hypothetical protein, partial [Sphingobium sp. WCS2017Hpa-17]|uniref:hypothetical protein n=1 Tax=Sphingobium sp. WCS2017Hpa-17 TaxID=3073638 RepID=UPI002888F9D5